MWRWRRLRVENEGVTLIELLAALVISLMIGAVLLGVLWSSASRSIRLLGYNAAQRKVVLVNHALTKELHVSDYVQIQYARTASNQEEIILWLYQGGFVQNPIPQNGTPLPWLYNTTTVLPSPATNSTATAMVGVQCFGAFVFTEQTDSTWNVLFTKQVPTNTAGASACATLTDVQSLQQSPDFTQSGLHVNFYFPDVTDASLSCKFVNSFIIKLSATYQTSTGVPTTYYLTAGYHDKDVR